MEKKGGFSECQTLGIEIHKIQKLISRLEVVFYCIFQFMKSKRKHKEGQKIGYRVPIN